MLTVHFQSGAPARLEVIVGEEIVWSKGLENADRAEVARRTVQAVTTSAQYPQPLIMVTGIPILFEILSMKWVEEKWLARRARHERADLMRCVKSEFIAAEMRNRK